MECIKQVHGIVEGKGKTINEWSCIANIKDCVQKRIMTANKSVAFKFYNTWGFGLTRGYIKSSLTTPNLQEGVAYLVRICTRAFPRVKDQWQKIKCSGKTPTFAETKCPLCGDKIEHGWEWEHLMMTCDHIHVEESQRRHLQKAINTLKEELRECPEVFNEEEVDVFGDRNPNGEKDIPLRRAIAIYLVGGVVNGFYTALYHQGFGQLDKLPVGHNTFGYVHTAKFLNEVARIYTARIFPNEKAFFANQGDLSSLPRLAVNSPAMEGLEWSPSSTQFSP